MHEGGRSLPSWLGWNGVHTHTRTLNARARARRRGRPARLARPARGRVRVVCGGSRTAQLQLELGKRPAFQARGVAALCVYGGGVQWRHGSPGCCPSAAMRRDIRSMPAILPSCLSVASKWALTLCLSLNSPTSSKDTPRLCARVRVRLLGRAGSHSSSLGSRRGWCVGFARPTPG